MIGPHPLRLVAPQYTRVISSYPGQAFYDMAADINDRCGYLELAASASKGFKSPVYLGENLHAPTSPVAIPYVLSTGNATMPFHIWDYMAGTQVRARICTRVTHVHSPHTHACENTRAFPPTADCAVCTDVGFPGFLDDPTVWEADLHAV